jgi:hypothetical protein
MCGYHEEEVAVLCLSFRKRQSANDNQMSEDKNIYNYHNKELVGMSSGTQAKI